MMVVIQGHSVLYIGECHNPWAGKSVENIRSRKNVLRLFPSRVSMGMAKYCPSVDCSCSWLIGLQWACVFCMFLVVLFVHVLSPYFLSGLPVTPRHVGNTPSRRNASKWMNRHSLEPQIHGVQSQKILVIVLFENDYVMIIYWNQLLITMMVGLCICWFDSYVIDMY